MDEAKEMFEMISKAFNVDESTKFQVPQISVNKIPEEKTKFLRVDGFNPKNNNTLITNYYQLGLGSMHKYMLLEVGCQIMEEPVFDTLRTKEQLGYSVFSMLRNTHGIIGLSITVNTQATKFTADHVDERIEAFLDWYINDKLKNLSDEEFNEIITTLIKMKSQADVTLLEEVNRNWSEINRNEYLFDRQQQEIKLLEQCDKKEMIEFMSNLLSKTEDRRKLSVQVIGSDVIDEEALEDKPNDAIYELNYHVVNKETFVPNVSDYKGTLQSYPIHKIVPE